MFLTAASRVDVLSLVDLMPLPVKTAVAGDLGVDFLDTKRLDCLSSVDLMLLTYIR